MAGAKSGKAGPRGYVQVYTGDGKGKTTAAVGLAVRAAGAGLRVYLGQFLKGRPCSEVAGLARFGEAVTVRTYGRGVFIRGAPAAEDVRAAQAGLDAAEAALAGGAYDLVILDEAVTAARLGLFPAERLTALIDRKPEAVELVLTGRGAGAALLEKADLVTDMRAVKHYFDAGVTARPGIEY